MTAELKKALTDEINAQRAYWNEALVGDLPPIGADALEGQSVGRALAKSAPEVVSSPIAGACGLPGLQFQTVPVDNADPQVRFRRREWRRSR